MNGTPKAVLFDCAETLIHVTWVPEELLADGYRTLGVELSPEEKRAYRAIVGRRWREYEEVSLKRDHPALKAWWTDVGREWFLQVGRPIEELPRVDAAADEIAFGPNSGIFSLFPDVVPCLERLRARGIRLAVVSNWDSSLGTTLDLFGLTPYFDVVLASLEEGVEKPDPRLFHLALDRLGLTPDEVVHVGDNPVDDGDGARAAGIRPILIDRTLELNDAIGTLDELETRWTD